MYEQVNKRHDWDTCRIKFACPTVVTAVSGLYRLLFVSFESLNFTEVQHYSQYYVGGLLWSTISLNVSQGFALSLTKLNIDPKPAFLRGQSYYGGSFITKIQHQGIFLHEALKSWNYVTLFYFLLSTKISSMAKKTQLATINLNVGCSKIAFGVKARQPPYCCQKPPHMFTDVSSHSHRPTLPWTARSVSC